MASFWALLTHLFSLPQEEKKLKKILNTLTNSDFISKCTNYYYYIYIYIMHINYLLFPIDNLFAADLSTG